MGKVLISVIIPVYNVEKYLRESLDSVIHQSFKDIEIVCVNDASTDSSLAILSEYEKKEPRLAIINHANNMGHASARNSGLSAARGEYISFVDPDDILKSGALEELYAFASQNDLDGVLFEADTVAEDGYEKYLHEIKLTAAREKIQSGIEAFVDLKSKGIYYPYLWCQFWRRSYLKTNNIKFVRDIHEDLLFSFQAITQASRICCVKKSYYIYRRRENSVTTSLIDARRIRAYIMVYLDILAFLKDKMNQFPPESYEMVGKYVAFIRESARGLYREFLEKGGSFSEIEFAKPQDRLLIHALFFNHYAYVGECLSASLLKKLKGCEHIIVYGAGGVGRDVIHLLATYGIENIVVAVSKKKEKNDKLMGYEIHEIGELQSQSDQSVVLISAMKQYQQEMIAYLDELGFTDYVCMA